MRHAILLMGMLGCSGSATDPTKAIKPPPPAPFAVTVSLTDTVIGDDCRYVLAFQANDSTTTVSFSWGISFQGSHIPGVGVIIGGATGSFTGRHERVWQWGLPSDGSSFFLALSWAVAATDYEASGGLSGLCP